jgi:hypothetical protein
VTDIALNDGDFTASYRNSKAGLQRTYRLNFAAEDDAGNVGTCSLTVKVK